MEPAAPRAHDAGFSSIVERNITALVARRKAAARKRGAQERFAQRVTDFAGSMAFVWLHVALFGAWVLLNVRLLPVRPFDPTFVTLAMLASVEALFLATFVLITQNRMAEEAEKRAELDLQVSLLAEHEVTRLISMVTAIAQHAGVPLPESEELRELQQDIAPEQVLDRIEDQ